MSTTTLDSTALAEIRARFDGDVLEEGDAGYDDARKLFNAMFDRKPRLIVRCTGAPDVVAGIALARETQLPLAIKSGGHRVNGHASCDDGILLDLSPMKEITVDPDARTVRAQAGVNWGEFDAATTAHGLATTGGRMTTTGIAGLTLGTGSGWLERLHGYTADNLISADVVTADGRIVHASEDENADLFWGLRGGGGNFGVVVNFEYRLHEVPPLVFGGMLLWPFERAGEIIRAYRALHRGCAGRGQRRDRDPHGSACAVRAARAARAACRRRRRHGVHDPERGEELIRPLRELEPLVDIVGPMPYTAIQQLLDPPNPPGLLNYWKAELVQELSDELIDATDRAREEDGTVALGASAPASRWADRADPGRRERDHRAARRMGRALHRRVGDARRRPRPSSRGCARGPTSSRRSGWPACR